MSKTALILIDIQNDYFPGGAWEVHDMTQAAANAAMLLRAARDKGQMILHIRHEIPRENAPFFQPGSQGAEINATVTPQDGEEVILKNFPNAFRETPLQERLQQAGVTDLILCGAMSQMCIDTTTRAAADLGYTVALAHDACAARALRFGDTEVPAPLVHAAYMAALDGAFARVIATETILG